MLNLHPESVKIGLLVSGEPELFGGLIFLAVGKGLALERERQQLDEMFTCGEGVTTFPVPASITAIILLSQTGNSR